MDRIWLVFRHEYVRHVLRKRFLFAILSLPLMIIVMALVGLLAVIVQFDSKPAGYVDLSGLLEDPITSSLSNEVTSFSYVEMIPYPDETTANAALEDKDIQAYFVLEKDYLLTGRVRLVARQAPGDNVENAFDALLKVNLFANQPEQVTARLLNGNDIVVRSATDDRELAGEQWFNLLIPIFSGVLFIIVINTSGGYLLGAVVEEKENRTIEIILTSISPTQLMSGKILGNLSVGLTQILIWAMFPSIAFLLLRGRVPFLNEIQIGGQFAWLVFITLVLAFIMIAALMAAIGATATESSEAQQISGLFTLPLVIPFWFITSIMTNPNGPLAVGLSIFPLTAPITLPMRAAFTAIPGWQLAISLGLLFCSSIGSLWLAGAAIRLGMLRYGKRLSLKELLRRRLRRSDA
ncbi:MAG: ABC transporter permease [Anaerolineaceae bacterium]|nr:ABC transporter permease [Anaerolineaceae bacterium]